MFSLLQILTVVLVAVAMVLAHAHALELPGKMRLSKETYYAMQAIYYPGFTIGGISEPVCMILTIILLFLMPLGSVDSHNRSVGTQLRSNIRIFNPGRDCISKYTC